MAKYQTMMTRCELVAHQSTFKTKAGWEAEYLGTLDMLDPSVRFNYAFLVRIPPQPDVDGIPRFVPMEILLYDKDGIPKKKEPIVDSYVPEGESYTMSTAYRNVNNYKLVLEQEGPEPLDIVYV